MIVAHTNLLAYFLIEGGLTPEARAVYQRDPEWIAPLLWRSEFRNVLILSIRRGILSFANALDIMDKAEQLIAAGEQQIPSPRILRLAADSGCSAYDCEFVALAQELGIPLVTADRLLIEKFKPAAVSMKAFCS